MNPNFEWREEEIYLDNAATTMVAPEVLEVMRPYLEERYGNPETVYRLGREAKDAVEEARHKVAELLLCRDDEVYFTSGGTESNNWALKGFQFGAKKTLAVSAVEHPSVLETARSLDVGLVGPLAEVGVDEYGMVRLDELEAFLGHFGGGLVSIQYANNEVGTIQPVREISGLCRKYGAIFHSDVVQAYGKVEVDVEDDGIDMASVSAHKIHGPMGIGALYVKKGTALGPLHHGGGHERGMRSGTLAVHDIVGFGKAAELAAVALKADMPRLREDTEFLASDMAMRLGAKINGNAKSRLPNIVNVTLPGMEASLICGLMCTKYGICVSSGSACSTASRDSHVLKAMGKGGNESSTLRISMSRYNTRDDLVMLMARLQMAKVEAGKRSFV